VRLTRKTFPSRWQTTAEGRRSCQWRVESAQQYKARGASRW